MLLALTRIEHTGRAAAFDDDPAHEGFRNDRQVASRLDGIEVRNCSAAAASVALSHLIHADTFLAGGVKIVIGGQPDRAASVDEKRAKRITFEAIADRQWTADAVIVRWPVLMILGF